VQKLKQFEVSKIRLEEAQKYRKKINQLTDEMEKMHREKVNELKAKE
jgi:hypothetical protein